jgi:hypothetical protein
MIRLLRAVERIPEPVCLGLILIGLVIVGAIQ